MLSHSSPFRTGVGMVALLGAVLAGLKLSGHIDWSWWWVTAPVWGCVVLVALFFWIATTEA